MKGYWPNVGRGEHLSEKLTSEYKKKDRAEVSYATGYFWVALEQSINSRVLSLDPLPERQRLKNSGSSVNEWPGPVKGGPYT